MLQVAKIELVLIQKHLLEIFVSLMRSTKFAEPSLYLGLCSTIPLFIHKYS